MKSSISIIIPAHNEEKRIGKTLEEYGKFFKNLKKEKKIKDFEINVVLNGCKDKTEEVVKKEIREHKEIKYIEFEQAGKGFAIIEGFKEALKHEGGLIGFVDADMATPPEAFYDLVENIKDYDGIIASRWVKGAKVTNRALTRRITSSGFNFIVRSLFLMPYRDTQCLPAFSEIFVIIDGKPVRNTIEKVKEKLNLGLIKKGGNFEVYSVKNYVKIPSLNKKNKKIELAPLDGFVIRKNIDKKLLKIDLSGGRTFFVSKNHPLMVFNNENFSEKIAKELKVGDFFPILKKWDLNMNIKYLDIIKYISNKDKQKINVCNWKKSLGMNASEISNKLKIPYEKAYNFYLSNRMPLEYFLKLDKRRYRNKLKLCFSGGKHTIPAKIKINDGLLRLIGYYISEGCCNCIDLKNRSRHLLRISFNKNEKDLIEETEQLFKKLFKIKPKKLTQDNCTSIYVYSRILCYLFKNIFECGINAKNKKVPEFVYGLSKEKIGNFMDCYFLGDGNIALRKQAKSICIRANSASEKLIKDLQLLLLRLDITSNIHNTKRERNILGRKIKEFNEVRWNLQIHSGSNIKKFEKYCPSISRKYKHLFNIFKNKNPSLYERKENEIKNSDLCLAKIRKITKVKYNGPLYDFKVQSDEKPYENFMHDAGIISHNCGAKIFRKRAIEEVLEELGITQWAFDVNLLYLCRKHNFKIKEHPTVWEDKEGSRMMGILRTSLQMFLGVVRLRLINSIFEPILRPIKFILKYPHKILLNKK